MPAKPNSQVNLPNTLNLIENHYIVLKLSGYWLSEKYLLTRFQALWMPSVSSLL
jgi:hypothetical protein